VKYLLIFLLVLVIFVISVTLGAHNDQVVSFNYLVAQGDYRVSTLLAALFAPVLFSVGSFAACFICVPALRWGVPNAKSKGWNCSLNNLLSRQLSPLSARNNLLC
jgi:lipopolysaccharide assembly protein A